MNLVYKELRGRLDIQAQRVILEPMDSMDLLVLQAILVIQAQKDRKGIRVLEEILELKGHKVNLGQLDQLVLLEPMVLQDTLVILDWLEAKV